MLHLVIIDSKVARILALDFHGTLMEVDELRNASAVAHESDLVSDRPGRVINGASGSHVALASKQSPRATSLQRWLNGVATHLRMFSASSSSEGLVLVASPRLLASLRRALSAEVGRRVLLEIPRDLAKHPLPALQRRLVPTLRSAVKRARHSPLLYRPPTFRAGD
jgi:protein required for attachment to host cells